MIPAVLAGGGLLLPVSITGADVPAKSGVQITDAWIRWIPANLPNAGYMTVQNTGNEPRVLMGTSSVDYQDIGAPIDADFVVRQESTS